MQEERKWQHTMVGRYLLQCLLGRGGAGEVWCAEDTQMHREVAVKLLPPTPLNEQSVLHTFEHEARAAATLQHPHVLPIYDFGQQQISRDEVVTYLVTLYVSGGTLRDRLRQIGGPMTSAEAIGFLRQAAEAIDYAHSQRVLHRDIKPANMLLQGDWLYLADFGLAKLLTSTTQRSKTNAGNGTPEYMAPEQAHGKAEYTSDVYSFAVTAYQLLTDRVPFKGDTPISTLMQQMSAPPPSPRSFNPALPVGVERVLLQGLAKNPQERPQSCMAFVNSLEMGWRLGDLAQADPDATTLAPWSRRRVEETQMSQPTPFSLPIPQMPTPIAPVAVQMEPVTAYSNEAFMPTYVTKEPEMRQPMREVPPPEERTRRAVSRRALLVGGASTLVLAGGVVGAFVLLRGQNATKPVVTQPTPTPVPGPKNLVAGVPLLSVTGHSKEVNVARWDPTGRYLATGGEDAMVMLWDIGGSVPKNATVMQPLATPVQAWRVPTAVFASGLCWSNDGRTLAVVTGNSQVSVIDAFKKGSTPQPYMDSVLSHSTNPPAYSFIDWSPRAGTFAVPSYVQEQMQQEIDIWQIGHAGGPVRKLTSDATGTPRTQLIDYIHPFNQTEVINAVSWSPDGSQLAAHTNFGTVTIWQTDTGKIAQTLTLPKRPTKDNPLFVLNECLAWSPVAPHVLAVSDIEAITIWDVQKNVLLHTLKPDYAFQFMTGLAWAPDGKYIAGTYAQTGKVRVWDVPAQATQSELLPRLLFPKSGVTVQRQTLTDVSWSPDGRYIASASGDATVVVWKVDA